MKKRKNKCHRLPLIHIISLSFCWKKKQLKMNWLHSKIRDLWLQSIIFNMTINLDNSTSAISAGKRWSFRVQNLKANSSIRKQRMRTHNSYIPKREEWITATQSKHVDLIMKWIKLWEQMMCSKTKRSQANYKPFWKKPKHKESDQDQQ